MIHFLKTYITVYRSLTGPRLKDEKFDYFQGVSDEVLKRTGILTVNMTHSHLSVSERYGMPNQMQENRKVPGLPVFFRIAEIERIMFGKKYLERPAIAVAKLPLDMLVGTDSPIQIWRTPAYEKDDYRLTEEMLRANLKRKEIISGECDLRGDLSNINQYVTFLRPEKMVEGFIKGKFVTEGQTKREK